MKSQLEQLLGCTPSPRWLSGVGAVIAKRSGVRFGDANEIETAMLGRYSTSRGTVPAVALIKLIDILADNEGVFSDDDHMEAENAGVWDWICHQGTLYSVSAVFLDRAILRSRELGRDIPVISSLASASRTSSTFLTLREYLLNRAGKFPIYRIEDVLLKYRWTATQSG